MEEGLTVVSTNCVSCSASNHISDWVSSIPTNVRRAHANHKEVNTITSTCNIRRCIAFVRERRTRPKEEQKKKKKEGRKGGRDLRAPETG